MRATFAPLAFAALAAAVPQAVTSSIAPSSSAPAGCSSSMAGTFEISVVNVTSSSKRDLEERQDSTLTLTLTGGWLYDSEGRTGYIASNSQFQFDKPPQAGAIYTAGWSVCSNGSLALGGSSVFYQCLSGTFYNLYDASQGAQCNQVTIQTSGGSSSPSSASAVATVQSDGQPTASPVSQITDGQPQASTGAAVTQITDGQPQASTGAPVSQITDGQPQASTAAAVSQISDGQPQATTGTAAPVTQISDGQPQATTGAPVSQISDGQPQASTAAAVTQISDGQPQAPTGANSTIAAPTASVQPYTGAAAPTAIRGELLGLAAGVLAIAML